MDTNVLEEYFVSVFRIEVSQFGEVACGEIFYGKYKCPFRSVNGTLKNKLLQSFFFIKEMHCTSCNTAYHY
jgi:hypothetical protein